MPTPTISPEALDKALAVVLDPSCVDCRPALIGGAWATLKAARGQIVDHSRLTPAHLIDRAPQDAEDEVTATYRRTVIRIRDHIARQGYARPGAGGAA